MQDYNYWMHGCMELTLELSCCKYPSAEELPKMWEQNRDVSPYLTTYICRGILKVSYTKSVWLAEKVWESQGICVWVPATIETPLAKFVVLFVFVLSITYIWDTSQLGNGLPRLLGILRLIIPYFSLQALLEYLTQAHKGVQGRVYNKQTSEPIDGAVLKIVGREMNFSTHAEGRFWRILLPGNYSLQVTSCFKHS